MEELISVIIPIYKVEAYLRHCIDSVLRQTYRALEIILVDDGSPDRCGEICDQYEKCDKRVRVIHRKNGGLAAARNTGLEASQGVYLAFLDSDDWVHEKYIETLYRLLVESGSDLASCAFLKTATEDIEVQPEKADVSELSNFEALRRLRGKLNVQLVVACCKLYKKRLFDGIRFPAGRLHEDEFTTYKLIYESRKIVLSSQRLYYYRQRESSITERSFDLKNRLDILDAYEDRALFFRDRRMDRLSTDAYRALFFCFLESVRNTQGFEQMIGADRVSKLKKELRKSRQEPIMKAFYELYFLMPRIMSHIFRLYTNYFYLEYQNE